ncbi:TetR/AcrR family transcriptional regulator [bacterium]|nr:TetR/AcrR family transcriptional regulator [bacterium]
MGRKNVQQERRLQILKGLNRCLLKKPYRETTIKDIAAETGINHGMLHYYYRDKEDILLNFVEYILDKYKQAFVGWIESQDFSGSSEKAVGRAILIYLNEKITLNKNLSKVFIALWEVSLTNRKVKKEIKRVYQEWIAIMADYLPAQKDDKTRMNVALAIVAFLEGMAMFSVVLNLNKEETRELLMTFQDRILESL